MVIKMCGYILYLSTNNDSDSLTHMAYILMRPIVVLHVHFFY